MKPKVIISKFTKSAIFIPSFIGHMQSRIALVTKNEPKDQKYNLILAPVDEPAQTIEPKLNKINECIDLLVGYDKWAAENLKKEIADILKGERSDA